MQSQITTAEFRRQFADTFRPDPWIYWSDLLASVGVGWSAFAVGARTPFGSPLCVVATLVAVVALLRAAIFIHELAHLKRRALPGLEAAWHLVVGLPFMLPSLMYVGSHSDHHRQTTFGTAQDPEYAPIARWSRLRIVGFIVSTLAVPLLLAMRWGVLGPLSSLVPPLRRLVVERASTLVINSNYRRPLPRGRQAIRWVLQEAATAVIFWSVVAGASAGWVSPRWLMQWYIVAAGVVLVNQVRTLAAHRYDNDGMQLDSSEQLLDSLTLSGWPIPTVLAAPLGLRYHTLHHWLPTVPYHSLGALHRRLLAELPLDSPYRHTQWSGILATVRDLLRQAPHGARSVSQHDVGLRYHQ
jgi:fatty acid desaturase